MPLWMVKTLIILIFVVPLAGGLIFLLAAAMVMKHEDDKLEGKYAG